MKPPVLFGIVFAVAIVAGWVTVPGLLKTTSERAADDAGRLVELARRQTAAYSTQLPRLEMVLGDELAALDANVRQDLEQSRRANQAVLDTAVQTAQQASRGDAPVNKYIAGVANMLRAQMQFAEAQRLRTLADGELNETLDLATDFTFLKGRADYYALAVTEPAIRNLERGDTFVDGRPEQQPSGSRQWVRERLEAARERLAALTSAAEAREAELEGLADEVAAARDARLSLESRGYTLGDDASFEAYRRELSAAFDRLRAVEQREHDLRWGSGGDPNDPASLSLSDLQHAAAITADLVERYESSLALLDKRVASLQTTGSTRQDRAAELQTRVDASLAAAEAQLPALTAAVEAALNAEQTALQAAAAARSAFAQAAQAAQREQQAAGQVQRSLDPERTDPRLARDATDAMPQRMAATSEAAAAMLQARLHLQRLRGETRRLQGLRQLALLAGGATIDVQAIEERIDTARTEGRNAAEHAVSTLESAARNANQATRWIPESMLGVATFLLAQFDDVERESLELQAASRLTEVIDPIERFPFASAQARFRDFLVRRTGFERPAAGAEPDEAAP